MSAAYPSFGVVAEVSAGRNAPPQEYAITFGNMDFDHMQIARPSVITKLIGNNYAMQKNFVLRPFLLYIAYWLCNAKPLRFEHGNAYLTSRQKIWNYRYSLEKGLIDPVAFAVEVSSEEAFLGGASVVDGFCGEPLSLGRLRDANLYVIGDSSFHLMKSNGRYHYLILIDVISRKLPNQASYPTFDLRQDTRDICLRAVGVVHLPPLRSNIVRVRRSIVDEALRGGVRPLPDNLGPGL